MSLQQAQMPSRVPQSQNAVLTLAWVPAIGNPVRMALVLEAIWHWVTRLGNWA